MLNVKSPIAVYKMAL